MTQNMLEQKHIQQNCPDLPEATRDERILASGYRERPKIIAHDLPN